MFVAHLEPYPALLKIMGVFYSFEISECQRGLKKPRNRNLEKLGLGGNSMFYFFLTLAFVFIVVIIILTAQFWFV